jgi:hypothetical protein
MTMDLIAYRSVAGSTRDGEREACPPRRALVLRATLGVVVGVPLLAWGVLSALSRRPLGPADAWTFAAAVARATPAHLGGTSAVETLRLGGRALGEPAREAWISAEGRGGYTIPLPPRTVERGESTHSRRFVTFATSDELHEYLHLTLAEAGWRYREQFGSMHVLDGDGAVLSVLFSFLAGTRVREMSVSVQHRGDVDAPE